MTVTGMFVNFAVTDLDRAKAFYTALGFTINPLFTDHNAACVVVEDGHSYFMVQTREFYQTMTELELGDPKVHPTAGTSIFLDTREAVDAAVAAGVKAGGAEVGQPADYGFMYQRTLTDPDGNIIEFGWMDPKAQVEGPEHVADMHA